MILLTLLIIAVICTLKSTAVYAGEDNTGAWGDQGDGTYNNPVLPADYADPDIIRVENDYFLITSTFQLSPGLTVLHSTDLVNWTIIGAAVRDLTQIHPRYNWDVMSGYSRGIWAPCLTYNSKNKTFYIHFGTPDEGFFMVKTQNPFGEWSDVFEVKKPNGEVFGFGWDDCGVLWDDDGQGYFIGTNFANEYRGWLHKINDDGYTLEDNGIMIHCSNDQYRPTERWPEAYKIFKKDGFYYFYHNGVEDDVRKAWVLRSEYIYGKKEDGTAGTFENPGKYEHIPQPIVEGFREPCQGNFIDAITPEGVKWYFWTHQGSTAVDGRPDSLIPTEWKNGWPMAGKRIGDSDTGMTIWENIPKPFPTSKIVLPQTNDSFDGEKLGYQWVWNFQPRADKWSLSERQGFMRLYAFKPLNTDKIDGAGNILLQRMYREDSNMAKGKIDISAMADGQNAGLLHSAGSTYSAIGIQQLDGVRCFRYLEKDFDEIGKAIPTEVKYIYFKSEWGRDCINRFYYSFDDVEYIPFGREYQLKGKDYRGDYIGFYNYNNLSESGYIDIDYLEYNLKQ